MPHQRPIQRAPNSKWDNTGRKRVIRAIHTSQVLRKQIRARPFSEAMAWSARAHDPARIYRTWILELPQVARRRVKQASHIVGALYATATADTGTRYGCRTGEAGEAAPL